MLTFNNLELAIFISDFFWPLVRILAFFSTAPIFNDQNVNKKIKIILHFIRFLKYKIILLNKSIILSTIIIIKEYIR